MSPPGGIPRMGALVVCALLLSGCAFSFGITNSPPLGGDSRPAP